MRNATKIKTSTGIWNVTYNAENRPVRWENTDTGTVITMAFDSQGRRVEYKSETNGVKNSWQRFFYKDYLCVQVLYSNAPYNVYKEFLWDPTEPVATRPLWFKYAEKNLFYAHDGNKNVSDLFYRATQNGVGAHYDYAPFGAITRTAKSSSLPTDILNENPFRFSSEYYDSELGLVYYNYRHYSPTDGASSPASLSLFAKKVVKRTEIAFIEYITQENLGIEKENDPENRIINDKGEVDGLKYVYQVKLPSKYPTIDFEPSCEDVK